jgi:hypothetical protein
VRLSLHWWGVHRSLTNRQKEVSAAYAADARFVTAGKKLVDTRHDAFRKLTAVRTRIVSYWRGLTLPYTEPGVRLIRQCDVEAFAHTMDGLREELAQAEGVLNIGYHQIKEDACAGWGASTTRGTTRRRCAGCSRWRGTFPRSSRPAT